MSESYCGDNFSADIMFFIRHPTTDVGSEVSSDVATSSARMADFDDEEMLDENSDTSAMSDEVYS